MDSVKADIISMSKTDAVGFRSDSLYNDPYKYSTREDLRWYLWLCEAVKWLEDYEGIICDVHPYTYGVGNPSNAKSMFDVRVSMDGKTWNSVGSMVTGRVNAMEVAVHFSFWMMVNVNRLIDAKFEDKVGDNIDE